MNIVFVTNNYFPYSGGVVSSINTIYDELIHQGHTVTIITLDFGNNVPDERNVIRLWCPLKFRYKQNHMAYPIFAQQQMVRLLTRINPDIIHAHHPFLLGAVAQKIARTMRKPFIFTYHTFYEKYLHYVPLPTDLTKYFVRKNVDLFCQKTNVIIAPSSAVKMFVQQENQHLPTIIIPSPLNSFFFFSTKKVYHYNNVHVLG